MKKFLIGLLTLGVVFSCGKKEEKQPEATPAAETKTEQKLIIGASPTPHAEILEQVKEDLKKEGVDLAYPTSTVLVKDGNKVKDEVKKIN